MGIICLTKENLNEPWILFESGALSKTKDAYVCTFLIDLTPSDITGPLSQFQHTKYEKNDFKILMITINDLVKERDSHALDETTLDEMYEVFWPKLDEQIANILKNPPVNNEPIRTDKEIQEEILEIVRDLRKEKNFQNKDDLSNEIKRLCQFYIDVARPDILTAETKTKKALYHSHNQLKDAFDHLAKIINNESMDRDEIDYQLGEFYNHISRAGTEAWELLILEKSIELNEIIDKEKTSKNKHALEILFKTLEESDGYLKKGREIKSEKYDEAVLLFKKSYEILDKSLKQYYLGKL